MSRGPLAPILSSHLSEGAIIEATVLARLLGLRLLRLEAHVAVLPAHARSNPHQPTPGTIQTVPRAPQSGDLREAARLLEHAWRTLDGSLP